MAHVSHSPSTACSACGSNTGCMSGMRHQRGRVQALQAGQQLAGCGVGCLPGCTAARCPGCRSCPAQQSPAARGLRLARGLDRNAGKQVKAWVCDNVRRGVPQGAVCCCTRAHACPPAASCPPPPLAAVLATATASHCGPKQLPGAGRGRTAVGGGGVGALLLLQGSLQLLLVALGVVWRGTNGQMGEACVHA